MTAKTSQKLAETLRDAGFEALAQRAENDEFHDFLSPHDLPALALDAALVEITRGKYSNVHRTAARNIRQRFHAGEFDASSEESDDWAKSEEGQAAFRRLVEGK
jgi:hypothetical protein